MMIQEAIEICDRLSYKPKARILAMRSRHDYSYLEIMVSGLTEDALKPGIVAEPKLFHVLSKAAIAEMNQDQFLTYVRKMLIDLETHEVDEWFKIDGFYVKDPHPELKPQMDLVLRSL